MTSVVRAALLMLAVCGGAQAAEDDLGARLFLNHCAACHGDDAEGTGPVAAAMRVTVPNLRSLAMRNGGSFPAEAVASYIDGCEVAAAHGDRQMPIWGDVFSAPSGTSKRTLRSESKRSSLSSRSCNIGNRAGSETAGPRGCAHTYFPYVSPAFSEHRNAVRPV